MKFEAVPPESEFEHIRAAWIHAAISTKQADPFCSSPAWQIAFHEALSPERRLLVESASGSVICFAEIIFSPSDIYLTPIETHWFFGCPLLGRHAVDLLVRAMECIAKEYAPHFPKIVISGIRPRSSLVGRLIQAFSKDFNIYLHSSGLQCAASLNGGLDGFLSRRSANFRSKLKKACKRASAKGVYFERILPVTPEDAAATYARMIAVEETSWKGIHACGMAEPPAKALYGAMISRLSQYADARVIMARYEDEDIGFISGGMAGNIYRGQQFSYNDAWKEFSIGNIMQFEQLKWLCEEKAVRYDMGPLDNQGMGYKAHWTEKRFPFQCWILEKR
jgi:CelD/BcsL family acetyltransferase involved in cellulose biosynthesis